MKHLRALAFSMATAVGTVTAQPITVETAGRTPVCKLREKCDAMWLAAMDAVGLATGMRTRFVTDQRIETFASNRASNLTGVVSKVPRPDGSTEIVLRLDCYRGVDCGLQAQGVRMFNTMVNGAALGFNEAEAKAFPPAVAPSSPDAEPIVKTLENGCPEYLPECSWRKK